MVLSGGVRPILRLQGWTRSISEEIGSALCFDQASSLSYLWQSEDFWFRVSLETALKKSQN